MKKYTLHSILVLLSIFAILLAACGSSIQTPDPVIATAVALTVAAQNAQQNTPTSTAIPTATVPVTITFPTPTQPLFPTPTKTDSNINTACAKASFVSETIPDGTIMKPDYVFTKTWQIKNDSSCTWDTTYKIIFWDGELMGGASYYNLPQLVAPGGVIDISLVLTAPAEEGEFTSYWMLQTPNNVSFGVGQYSEPFYASILVSKEEKPETAITDVKLEVIREPAAGCATNVYYRYVAKVSANGKIKIRYGFNQSDGNFAWIGQLEFKEAGTQTITGPFWSFHLGSTPGQKWVQFVVYKPYRQSFEKHYFDYLCGNTP